MREGDKYGVSEDVHAALDEREQHQADNGVGQEFQQQAATHHYQVQYHDAVVGFRHHPARIGVGQASAAQIPEEIHAVADHQAQQGEPHAGVAQVLLQRGDSEILVQKKREDKDAVHVGEEAVMHQKEGGDEKIGNPGQHPGGCPVQLPLDLGSQFRRNSRFVSQDHLGQAGGKVAAGQQDAR